MMLRRILLALIILAIEAPRYDSEGNIDKRGCYGGNYILPNLSGYKVLGLYLTEGKVYVLLDLPLSVDVTKNNNKQTALLSQKIVIDRNKIRAFTGITKEYSFLEFGPSVLTDEVREYWLKWWKADTPPPPVSGVTD